MVDHVLGPVEVVLPQPVDGLGPERPVELEGEEPPGGITQCALPKPRRRGRLEDRVAEQAEVFLDQVDVRHAEAVQVPVIQDVEQGEFLLPGDVVVAGAEVAVAELPTVEGHVSQVVPAVLQGMEQAPDALLLRVEEAQVLAAVDHLVALCRVLTLPDPRGECRQVARAADGGAKKPGPRPQAGREGWAGAVRVIVEAAAGAAGFAGVGLAEVDEAVARHSNTTVLDPCTRIRFSRCRRTARARTTRSRSLPFITMSSTESRWLILITSWAMIGPSSRFSVT